MTPEQFRNEYADSLLNAWWDARGEEAGPRLLKLIDAIHDAGWNLLDQYTHRFKDTANARLIFGAKGNRNARPNSIPIYVKLRNLSVVFTKRYPRNNKDVLLVEEGEIEARLKATKKEDVSAFVSNHMPTGQAPRVPRNFNPETTPPSWNPNPIHTQ
jgi:hypothetical protein